MFAELLGLKRFTIGIKNGEVDIWKSELVKLCSLPVSLHSLTDVSQRR